MLSYDAETLKTPTPGKCRIPQRLPNRIPPTGTNVSPVRAYRVPEVKSENSLSVLNKDTRCWHEKDQEKLKESWHRKLQTFEKMKTELNERQKAVLDLYSKMKNTHRKISNEKGPCLPLPSPEGLQIMNLSQQQLQKICNELNDTKSKDISSVSFPFINSLSFDLNKLTSTPNRLVAACERTLIKRKEIIDWFDSIRSDERKCISMSTFSKKINEFYAENDMMNRTLQSIKEEFLNELKDFMNCFKKYLNETVSLQLRAAEMTAHVSELKDRNTELHRKVQLLEEAPQGQLKTTKKISIRIKELENELNDEKNKRIMACSKLCRAEGQIKITTERTTQLEAALEQARSEAHSLQRTILHLQEANQKLQLNFDKELNKLTESIKENTQNVEEIAEAREKLQAENRELEKRFHDLAEQYSESIKKMKAQMAAQVAKIAEAEIKYNNEKKDLQKYQEKVNILTEQLKNSESTKTKILSNLNDTEEKLNTTRDQYTTLQSELEIVKRKLNKTEEEIHNKVSHISEKNEYIGKLEKLIEEKKIEKSYLQSELNERDEQMKHLLECNKSLDENLKQREISAKYYQDQLAECQSQLLTSQNEIQMIRKSLQDMDIADLEQMRNIKLEIDNQLTQLKEKTKTIEDLTKDIQNKENKLKYQENNLLEQKQLLSERDEMIKMLKQKEEYLSNLVRSLQDKLEHKMVKQIRQKTEEQNEKIDSLTKDIETSKKVISNLENAMFSLNEQLRSLTMKRKIDKDKIALLEQTVAEYELIESKCQKAPVLNLNNLIKMLEDELEAPLDIQIGTC